MPERDGIRLMTLRDYARIVWLRKWIVVAIVVAFTVAAYLIADSKPRVYEATARLMYTQQLAVGTLASGITAIDPNSLTIEMQSAVGLGGGPEVAGRAAALLGNSTSVPHYTVTATIPTPTGAAGSTTVSSTELDITVKSPIPQASAAVANAYAQALIGLEKDTQVAQLRQAEIAVRSQMRTFVTPKLKQTGDYLLLAQELQNLQILENTSTGGFAVLASAMPPSAPISPRPKRTAAMGLAAGLFVGVALTFVLSQFDNRVRSTRELFEELGMPVIGRVPSYHGRNIHNGWLAARSEPRGKVAEAMRTVRSAIDYADSAGELRSLLFVSGKSGEGKTTTVCNLAVTLANAGKHVVVVDADLRNPCVHQAFDVPNDVGLSTVVMGGATLRDVLRPIPLQVQAGLDGGNGRQAGPPVAFGGASRLVVLTSGPLQPNPGEIVVSPGFVGIMSQLAASSVDYVLVDSAPFELFGDAAGLAASVDGLVLVVDMRVVRVPALEHAQEFLQALPAKKVGVIAVGVKSGNGKYHGSAPVRQS